MEKVAGPEAGGDKCGSCGAKVIRARGTDGRIMYVDEAPGGLGRLGIEWALIPGELPTVFPVGTRTRFKQHRCRTAVRA